MKLLFIVIIAITIMFFYYQHNIEGYIDVEKEFYQNEKTCNSSNNTCNNFVNCCLDKKDIKCRNSNLLACQKFRIKCENKCNNKKTDDNGTIFKNEKNGLSNCIELCQQVKTDCCRRLDTF